jgi:hypothetical protein
MFVGFFVWSWDVMPAASGALADLGRFARPARGLLAQAQAEAQAALGVAGAAAAEEFLEDEVAFGGRDAAAGVDHVEPASAAAPARRDQHAAALRVAHRVADEVGDDALQQPAVALHHEVGRAAHGEAPDGIASAGLGSARLHLVADRTPVGDSIGPRSVAFWRFFDEQFDAGIGPLEAPPDVCC